MGDLRDVDLEQDNTRLTELQHAATTASPLPPRSHPLQLGETQTAGKLPSRGGNLMGPVAGAGPGSLASTAASLPHPGMGEVLQRHAQTPITGKLRPRVTQFLPSLCMQREVGVREIQEEITAGRNGADIEDLPSLFCG